MPTGGVAATEESIQGWAKASTAWVGIGSKLITKELVAAGDFEAISEKVRQGIAWIRQVHGEEV
jgi:2-dehydro-3-deoxyphosphogluconate aldolase/(4S)-4-hydroxy-2-oxoglutarate aldolase